MAYSQCFLTHGIAIEESSRLFLPQRKQKCIWHLQVSLIPLAGRSFILGVPPEISSQGNTFRYSVWGGKTKLARGVICVKGLVQEASSALSAWDFFPPPRDTGMGKEGPSYRNQPGSRSFFVPADPSHSPSFLTKKLGDGGSNGRILPQPSPTKTHDSLAWIDLYCSIR